MDLQALMMGSESLLTHIARPDGIPRLDKSLAEIVSVSRLPRSLCLVGAAFSGSFVLMLTLGRLFRALSSCQVLASPVRLRDVPNGHSFSNLDCVRGHELPCGGPCNEARTWPTSTSSTSHGMASNAWWNDFVKQEDESLLLRSIMWQQRAGVLTNKLCAGAAVRGKLAAVRDCALMESRVKGSTFSVLATAWLCFCPRPFRLPHP